jgi:DNA-binding MarR family transcriptional regulator
MAKDNQKSGARAPRARSTTEALDQASLLNQIGYHVRRADLCLLQAFRRHVSKPLRLRPVEFSVLSLLACNEGVTYKALGEALDVSGPHLAPIIAGMVRRKLVARRPNPLDGRSMLLSATPSGTRLLGQARTAVGEMEDELLGDWPPRQRAQLMQLLSRIHGLGAG